MNISTYITSRQQSIIFRGSKRKVIANGNQSGPSGLYNIAKVDSNYKLRLLCHQHVLKIVLDNNEVTSVRDKVPAVIVEWKSKSCNSRKCYYLILSVSCNFVSYVIVIYICSYISWNVYIYLMGYLFISHIMLFAVLNIMAPCKSLSPLTTPLKN